MGFFSYTCAKSNLPILAGTSWGDRPEATTVVVVFKDGRSAVHGQYDGYGRVDGVEVMEDIESGRAKMVLRKYWQQERFSGLGKNENEPGQGHFHDEQFIDELYSAGPLPSARDYYAALQKYEGDMQDVQDDISSNAPGM